MTALLPWAVLGLLVLGMAVTIRGVVMIVLADTGTRFRWGRALVALGVLGLGLLLTFAAMAGLVDLGRS